MKQTEEMLVALRILRSAFDICATYTDHIIRSTNQTELEHYRFELAAWSIEAKRQCDMLVKGEIPQIALVKTGAPE